MVITIPAALMLAQTISNNFKARHREIQHSSIFTEFKMLLYFLDKSKYLFAVGNKHHVVFNIHSIIRLCVFRKGTGLNGVEERA